ncbi:sigma-70 family RNA polymerase sigma factor [Planctomycetales bacterium ZRK34]|nr:sigma-70 family RNA polymerase sigma factor [Planctomycetales bacterium ZRK34]
MALHAEQSDRYTKFAMRLTRARPGLHSFITTLTPNFTEAEKTLRDASLVLWEQYDDYEPGTNFLSWACRIVRRQVIEHRHAASPDAAAAGFSAALIERLADETLVDAELERLAAERRAAGQCIAKLQQGDRNLIRVIYGGKQTAQAIAAQLNRPVQSVHQRLCQLRRAVEQCAQRTLDGEGGAS